MEGRNNKYGHSLLLEIIYLLTDLIYLLDGVN